MKSTKRNYSVVSPELEGLNTGVVDAWNALETAIASEPELPEKEKIHQLKLSVLSKQEDIEFACLPSAEQLVANLQATTDKNRLRGPVFMAYELAMRVWYYIETNLTLASKYPVAELVPQSGRMG
jgi:hypothetical protein